MDGAQGVTAKAGDEADGGQKRGSREKEIANYTTTIRQLYDNCVFLRKSHICIRGKNEFIEFSIDFICKCAIS